MPSGHYLTREQQDAILAAYQSGKTGPQIAREMGLVHSCIYRVLRRNGVDSRTFRSYRTYSIDESYFSTIDTEEKAYWLGFILADGNVQRTYKQGSLYVNLHRSDRGHLEKLKAALRSDGPVTDYEYLHDDGRLQLFTQARFHSAQIADDLIRLGIVPRKSLIVKPWIGPDYLMRHYWRGAVDGDGCICLGSIRGSPVWEINLVGTEAVTQAFADFVASIGGPPKKTRKKSKREKIFRIRYDGTALPQIIVRALYENATVYLDRKKVMADQLIAIKPRLPYRGPGSMGAGTPPGSCH